MHACAIVLAAQGMADVQDDRLDERRIIAEGWNKRATLYYLMGRHEESLADIDRVIKLEPRHFGALSGAGLVNMALERPEAALKAFKRALDANPHMPSAEARVKALERFLRGRRI